MAALIFGFENLAHPLVPAVGIASLFAAAGICFVLYSRHARGNPNAVMDLGVFRIPTFAAPTYGGAFLRLTIGSQPFLLALLLQLGFGMTAFRAGALTFISAAGSLFMKVCAPPILRRFGFRPVLVVNGVLCGVTFAAYSLFRPSTPIWILMAVLGLAGFFRSLQFSALNSLAFADIERHQMSRASTVTSVIQQVIQSVGIALAAIILHLTQVARHEPQLTWQAVAPSFAIIGALTMISIYWFARLPPAAGEALNGRRPSAELAPSPRRL
jgi:hypothetical protein